MESAEVQRTQFSVSDYLSWQRQGLLDLSPPFQRRSVWAPGAKSYLIDTVVRNLSTPLIFLRETIDLDTLKQRREVIDGQQRLRTLFSFIDPTLLPDYSDSTDKFVVRREHNSSIANKPFKALSADVRQRILTYQFSTHVLPTTTEDRDVLMIFARLNSTGTPLNKQELRNAEYFGAFKTLMYQLAYEQLERWPRWGLFDYDDIARMEEVETTSDLVINMVEGVSGKSQPALNSYYRRFDETFPNGEEVATRFRLTMDLVDDLLGDIIARTVYARPVYFVTLFSLLYDVLFGLGGPMDRKQANRVPSGLRDRLLVASNDLRAERVPEEVLDAVQRASADLGRRQTRLDYLREVSAVATGVKRRR